MVVEAVPVDWPEPSTNACAVDQVHTRPAAASTARSSTASGVAIRLVTERLVVDTCRSSLGCWRATKTPDEVTAIALVLPLPRSTDVARPVCGDGVIDGAAT